MSLYCSMLECQCPFYFWVKQTYYIFVSVDSYVDYSYHMVKAIEHRLEYINAE